MTLSLGDASASAIGIVALLISLLCLGTWPALIRLCTWGHHDQSQEQRQTTTTSKLFVPQSRHVCHVYLDYSFSYVLSSSLPLVLSLILSSSSSQDQQQHHNDSFLLIVVAMIGGALLSLGNLAMQWSVSVFGAPLTTVLAIQASMTVVLGTCVNYVLEPSKTARPPLLACGMLAFLVAIGLATFAQDVVVVPSSSSSVIHRQVLQPHGRQYVECSSNSDIHDFDDNDDKTQRKDGGGGFIALSSTNKSHQDNEDEPSHNAHETNSWIERPNRCDSFCSDDDPTILPPGSGIKTHNDRRASRRGLCIAFAGGLCFGFFSPAFNIAVNDPFDVSSSSSSSASEGGLSVVVANLWFGIAFCLASVLGNVYLMTRQYTYFNDVAMEIQHSTLRLYLTRESLTQRRLALLAGLVCALGNVLQFQGGKLAGFATADLVQAFPLVSTLWDVLLFGEFRQRATTPVRRHVLLLTVVLFMYIAYICGIVLMAFSIDY